MNFIDNWKISTKVLSVIAVLSGVIIMLGALGANALLSVDGVYGDLTQSHYPATIAMIRANRSLNQIGYAAYRTIAYDGASAEAKAAGKAAEDSYAAAAQYIADAARLDSADKAIFEAYKPKLDAIHTVVQSAVAHGLKNENDEATKEMVKGDALLEALSSEITKYNAVRIAAADTASVAASANAHSTTIMMAVIGVAGLVIGVGIGLWVAMAKIARPLVGLGGRMSTLAQGKLDTEIEGTERKDEIGQMARTVLVFRDAGLEKVRLEKAAA
jgi:methyl-accepting chemotaxis protein